MNPMMTTIIGAKEGEYDLEWAKRGSGKDWFWFSQCFTKGKIKVFPSAMNIITIGGRIEFEKLSGWGVQAYEDSAYIGNFIKDELNGDGIWIDEDAKYFGQFANHERNGIGAFTFQSGVKYEGEWSNNYFDGLGSITYPDGIQYEGQWNMDEPGCMDCFIIF